MAKPTQEQMQKIKRFTNESLTEDDVFVFNNLMIDDQPTSFYSVIHENLLRKFTADAAGGIPLMLVHNTNRLPVGKSFDAYMKEDIVDGSLVKSVYGQFYMPYGLNTDSGLMTDDIIKGIETGVHQATSIGFSAKEWKCSICGNDIRDYWACPHYPGKKYAVNNNGIDEVETCYVIVGENGEGSLNEDSLVYSGASFRAGIRQNFGRAVNEGADGSKLRVIDDFKDIPVNATVYQFYTKDGSVLMVDTEERTGGAQYLKNKGVEEMELVKVQEALGTFGVKFNTIDELTAGLQEFSTKVAEVEAYKGLVDEANQKLATAESAADTLRAQLTGKDEIIAELTKENEHLAKDAELARTYKEDLLEKALELGVRANGNAFNKDVHQKLFSVMSVDELKEVVAAFDAQVKEKFAGASIAGRERGPVTNRRTDNEPAHADDFASEVEFRSYVGEKAMEQFKSQVAKPGAADWKSLTQITTELMHKFLNKSE